jgi:tRNA-uridine 2-sulfurtransferase
MKKVFVGLSGGVDSAVAAYLLIQQGYHVECGFMRNWDASVNSDIAGNPTIDDDMCPQEVDYMDALNVANKLNVPLHRVDFVAEYWQDVFSVFVEQTKRGLTPNPDILCNKHIKFDAFVDYAKKHGFDYVATGHYARIVNINGEAHLAKAIDQNKDQTYFLVQIPKDVLSMILFPLGEITKDEVRKIALEQDFVVAKKKDSTGICFIGERHFKEFMSNYIPKNEGNIIDIETKKVLGQHHGVMFYTLGQRKGLNIGGDRGPWFVVWKHLKSNQLIVAQEHHPYLKTTSVTIQRVNLLSDSLTFPLQCHAKFRYRQADQLVVLDMIDDKLVATFPQGIKAVTPGQEAVFYLNHVCIGGGQIEEIYLNNQPLRTWVEKEIKDEI